MDAAYDLQTTLYSLLEARIKFGTWKYGELLPSMEDTSRYLMVSVDTVRSAYLQLRREGYITLSTKIGARVNAQYSEQELEQNIQTFFALRRDAMLDAVQSIRLLTSHAQWLSLKNASPARLDELEMLCHQGGALLPYVMTRHLQLIYGIYGNDILTRLIWHRFMFVEAPFLSVREHQEYFEQGDGPLLHMIRLCRARDWEALRQAVLTYQGRLCDAMLNFFEKRIVIQAPGEPIRFQWSVYKQSSQRCYTLAMNLILDISRGVYPPESYLPSLTKLAMEKRVSVSTVRRALGLLNRIGATRTYNGSGTKVLPPRSSADNCDFSQPGVRIRLLDFMQSLQILALSMGTVAEAAITAMDTRTLNRWKKRLLEVKHSEQYELTVYTSLGFIAGSVPCLAVRTVYDQLLKLLLWGYPLRSTHGSREAVKEFYTPVLKAFINYIEQSETERLAAALHELINYEFSFAQKHLASLGLNETGNIIIPEDGC